MGITTVDERLDSPSLQRVPEAQRARIVWYRQAPVQRRLRLLVRLAQMGPHEIAHRVSRRIAKHATRWQEPRGTSAALPPVLSEHPVHYLSERTTPVGFFDLRDRARLAALAREEAPADVARTIAEADAIVTDGVSLLGRKFRPASADFDWHADPDHGRLWPLSTLDDADAVRKVNADVKFVWEVNRHQFFVTLARASTYSGDPRYAECCVAMLRSWIHANPVGIGVNWSSNLEVATRATAWIWMLHFLVGTPALTDDDLRLCLTSLVEHRDYLVPHLSTYTDVTNHLIGEAAALTLLSLWLPELPDSERHRGIGIAALAETLPIQVADDGVSREQATSYQRFVLDWLVQVVVLAERNHLPLPAILTSRVRAMLAAVSILTGPGGRAPRIGDSDEARGIPFFTSDFWNFEEVLALGASIAGSTRRADSATYESAIWLNGGLPSVANDTRSRPERSVLLAEGGYAVLQSLNPTTTARLVFDCGPLGLVPHASHGHADLLSVLVDVGTEEFLIDPGTYAYWDERGYRNLFRSTRLHNTVEIGGHDQADAFDPFKWLNYPRSGLSEHAFADRVEYVEAWHDGYQRLRPGARHRRGVLALAGGWLIVDWLEGTGSHQFTRWFHAAPGVRAELIDPTTIRLVSPSGAGYLLLRDVGAAADMPTPIVMETAPYSERYGIAEETLAIRFDDGATLPALRVLMCIPGSPAESAPPLELLDSTGFRDGEGFALRFVTATRERVTVCARIRSANRDSRLSIAFENEPASTMVLSGTSSASSRLLRTGPQC